MIFSCAVRFSKNIIKIPDLSLPPCICRMFAFFFQRPHNSSIEEIDSSEELGGSGPLRNYGHKAFPGNRSYLFIYLNRYRTVFTTLLVCTGTAPRVPVHALYIRIVP
jgi:hypothetical protein